MSDTKKLPHSSVLAEADFSLIEDGAGYPEFAEPKDEMVEYYRETIIPRTADADQLSLGKIFPHSGNALVATYGFITESYFKSEGFRLETGLVLARDDIYPYVEGHDWAFPNHWQLEMAAQAAGLRYVLEVLDKYGPDVLDYYSVAMTRKTGEWQNGPLPVLAPFINQSDVVAKVVNFDYELVNRRLNYIKYTADVELSGYIWLNYLQKRGKATKSIIRGIEVTLTPN